MLRGLLGLGGVVLAYVAWPVAQGAWQAQKADLVVYALRTNRPLDIAAVDSAARALDRAVAADPVAGRRIGRSEFLVGAALRLDLPLTPEQRTQWLKTALSDLDFGLANAPARGVAWARLAAVNQALGGPSVHVIPPIMMSLDTAPSMESLWPARMQLILDNWKFFTPEQRARIATYVAMTWRASADRRWFAKVIRSPIDELFVRYFVRDEPNAQEELTKWLERQKKE